jgi:hypothetical protein
VLALRCTNGPEATLGARTRPKVEYGFFFFGRLLLQETLAIRGKRAYLAATSPTADVRIVNQQERNEDEFICPIHHPCKLHARTHPQAHQQTLARDLSQQTNVTTVTPSSSSSDKTPALPARQSILCLSR